MSTVDELLSGSTKSASFPNVGHVVEGVIVSEPRVVQATEYKTNKPLTWDDGRPQENIVIVLQTDERDPSVENDDGRRSLYVKAWGDQLKGLRAAIAAAGPGSKLAQGGRLGVRYAGDGIAEGGGYPPKLYEYRYTPPSRAAVASYLDAPAQPQQQYAPQQPQQFAPPAQPQQQAPQGWGAPQQQQQQQYAPPAQPQQQQAPSGWATAPGQQPPQPQPPAFGENAGPAPEWATSPSSGPTAQGMAASAQYAQSGATPGYTPEQIEAAQRAGYTLPGMAG